MKFHDLVMQRHSVRAYKPDPVPAEKLQAILETVRMAPSAHNSQPFRLLVIHTAGREEELKRIYGRDWFVQPPLVIAVCGLTGEAWERRRSDGKCYLDVDAAIAMDHLILAATEQGLGTCWIAAFDPDAAREVLGLPADVEPIVFTPLGYPAVERPHPQRKTLAELVRYERWSE